MMQKISLEKKTLERDGFFHNLFIDKFSSEHKGRFCDFYSLSFMTRIGVKN